MSDTVLIVDDEPNIVKMVEARLKSNGYEVLTATGGEEGLHKCKRHKPDAVVLDILMPDMDGSAVAAAIREDPDTRKIPIIFLTGIIKPNEVPKSREIGGQYFITKPFNSRDLLDILNHALGNKE